jgi:hypothetical protein
LNENLSCHFSAILFELIYNALNLNENIRGLACYRLVFKKSLKRLKIGNSGDNFETKVMKNKIFVLKFSQVDEKFTTNS